MRTEKIDSKKPPVVTFLTRVVLSLDPDFLDEGRQFYAAPVTPASVRQRVQDMRERAHRVAEMMELLEKFGFVFSAKKQVVTAYSDQVEAYEVKRELKKAGFADREFQIILEYTRGWGML